MMYCCLWHSQLSVAHSEEVEVFCGGRLPVYSLLFFFLCLILNIVLIQILKGFRVPWLFLLYREDRPMRFN